MTQARKSLLLDLTLLSLLIGLLFGLFLSQRPLVSPDESRYSEIPRQMLLHHDYVTPRINNIKYFEKPPLVYWLQTASIRVFGMNEWGFRFATAFMGFLGCLATYFAGRTLFNRQTGLLAGGILATSSLYFGLARFVTLDMTLSVLMSATLLCFALAEHTKNRRYLWGMYISAALATLTKGFIGFILPGLILFLWVAWHRQWRALKHYHLLGGIIVFLAIAIPWHWLAQINNPEFLRFYVLDQQILRYFTDISGREQAVWFLPLVLIGGFLPWTVWLPNAIASAWQQIRQHDNRILSLLLLWPACVFLLFWFSKSQLSPYILPMFPALALLTARYLDTALRQNRNEWRSMVAFALCAIVLCIAGIFKFRAADTAIVISLLSIVITALLTLLVYWEKGLRLALATLALGYSVFLLSLNFSLPKYDSRSIRPLVAKLQHYLKPGDTVNSFHHMYTTLPVYLNRNITLVNYYGELKFGIRHGDVSDVWISDAEFWRRWQLPARQFVVMDIRDFHRYAKSHKYSLYLLGQTRTNALVANQEIHS